MILRKHHVSNMLLLCFIVLSLGSRRVSEKGLCNYVGHTIYIRTFLVNTCGIGCAIFSKP